MSDPARRLLITAGPTHEPIDQVRYLANRSSGRLGIALADAACDRGWRATILLGPTRLAPSNTSVAVHRFRTAADLQTLLTEHAPRCDALIMAAAVADYRPAPAPSPPKVRRGEEPIDLRLLPTPDLIAEAARRKRPEQVFIGFALEPREGLEDAAREKLRRKGLDAIVANPLETMDAETIEAVLLTRSGERFATESMMSKEDFANWLLTRLGDLS